MSGIAASGSRLGSRSRGFDRSPPDLSADALLAAAPPAGVDKLAALRDVMERALLPALASRTGLCGL
jgi:hypothetical protein